MDEGAGPSTGRVASSSTSGPLSLNDVRLAPGDNFDWEAYTAAYPGSARTQRLIYIATHCPHYAEAAARQHWITSKRRHEMSLPISP